MSLIQILYECFYDTESTTDVSTMVYNMNLVRNSNARGNVIDNFSACKEYANFESDAYGVALALKYFGMKDITTPEDQVIPPHIRKADAKSKRIWLNGRVKKMLTDYLIHEHRKNIIIARASHRDSGYATTKKLIILVVVLVAAESFITKKQGSIMKRKFTQLK